MAIFRPLDTIYEVQSIPKLCVYGSAFTFACKRYLEFKNKNKNSGLLINRLKLHFDFKVLSEWHHVASFKIIHNHEIKKIQGGNGRKTQISQIYI